MNTYSFPSALPIFQPFVMGISDGNHQQLQEKGIENAETDHQRKRLSNDFYQPSQVVNNEARKGSSIMALQSLVSHNSQSVDIQVKTREGDTVSIRFNQSGSSSQTSFQAEQRESQFSLYQQSSSFESSFSFSVDGDLNEGEKQSISDLLDKINQVSDEFFNGNVKTAFEHALKVGFDTEQIAAFSLDLNMKSSIEAIMAYQQVAMLEQIFNTDLIAQARDFLAETNHFIAESRSLFDLFADPKQSFTDLLTAVAKMHPQNLENNERDPLLPKVIGAITDELFRDKAELLES